MKGIEMKITGNYTQTVELNGQKIKVTFTATASMLYTVAQVSGPPERCYPEETDLNLESISITEARTVSGAKIPLALHTMRLLLREAIDEDLLAEKMWEEFDQSDES
jgi:hypothetical protein